MGDSQGSNVMAVFLWLLTRMNKDLMIFNNAKCRKKPLENPIRLGKEQTHREGKSDPRNKR